MTTSLSSQPWRIRTTRLIMATSLSSQPWCIHTTRLIMATSLSSQPWCIHTTSHDTCTHQHTSFSAFYML